MAWLAVFDASDIRLIAPVLIIPRDLAYQQPRIPQTFFAARHLGDDTAERGSGPTRIIRMGPLRSFAFSRWAGRYQAVTRAGSSTIEKRTPALCRFSSDTSRQQSSASLRLLNGPLTWAEPSTSLWKFIEPNSPPITQKLLPLVMILSCYSAA